MSIQKFVLVGQNRKSNEVQDYVRKMKQGAALKIEREPSNPFDNKAIKVYAIDPDNGHPVDIGYIPKGPNRRLAGYMDSRGLTEMDAKFEFAGTGKSGVDGVAVEIPDED